MKLINKLPTASQTIDKEVDKLFNPKLQNLLGYAFPFICFVGWVAILCSILFS